MSPCNASSVNPGAKGKYVSQVAFEIVLQA